MTARLRASVARFFFFPASDEWIAVLRIGLGLQVVLYCFSLRHSWSDLFASTGSGLLSRQLAEAVASADSPLIPRLGWLVKLMSYIGVGEQAALSTAWLLLLGASLLLVVGLFSRIAAVVAWLLHVAAATSAGLLSYGVDNFMTIGLFYLAIAPLPDRYALDHRLRGHTTPRSELLGSLRRVLQLHLCIVYLFGGLAKALGSGWWDGANIWRALTRDPFNQLPLDCIAAAGPLLPTIGIAVWVVELGYLAFIWPHRTRTIWLALTCLMHLGIGFAMGMHLFAMVMIVLNVAAFGRAEHATLATPTPQREPACS